HPGGAIKSAGNRFGDDFPGVDVKADGGYVVAPPSLHQSGRRYVVTVDRPLAELPQTWLDALLATQAPPAPATRRELAGTETYEDDGARWLSWALEHTGAGASDVWGYKMAVQLLVNRTSDPEHWLGEYAAAASFDPGKPFSERDIARW